MLAAKRICNHISFAGMIMDFQIIILDQFQPSSLPHIQIRLSENILETLVVSADIAVITHQVVPQSVKACTTAASSRS
jgi:hypothetical protein